QQVEEALRRAQDELENHVHERTAELVQVNNSLRNEIEERRRVDEALRHSELLFRLVWEESADGMRLTDINGTIVAVNDAFCRMVGLAKEAIEGQPMSVIYAVERRPHVLQQHRDRFASGTVRPHLTAEVTLWNSEKRWFEVGNSFLDL